MRVVAGSAGGLRLQGPQSGATRPTTDKVREAIFNSLQSAMVLEGASVLDLFAGTGACGIEALSRGAAHATFVERERGALAVLEQNLKTTGMSSRAKVVRLDVMTFVKGSGAYSLAFADPPYEFSEWAALLDVVDAHMFVCESNRTLPEHPRWRSVRERKYGTTVVTYLEPIASAAP